MSTLTISLKNKTLLNPQDYTIYVMGFSSTSKLQLTHDSGTKAKFSSIPSGSGNLNILALSATDVNGCKAITEIDLDKSTDIAGARIYFFFSKKATFPDPPTITYSNGGKDVVNVPNPPNADFAPYTYAEFTNSPGYGSVIDSQTVDGLTAPVTIEIFDGTTSLGAVGNDLSLNRKQIISAFKPFINGLSDSTASDFSDLQYSKNEGGLLNPGAFLNDVSDTNEFNNIGSKLNELFDDELNTFFKSKTLSIKGVSHGKPGTGAVSAQVYKSTPVSKELPGTSFSHQALKLEGASNTFYIWNPVGVCAMTDGTSPILGSVNDLKMTFATPLSQAKIVAGMSIMGIGIPANQVTVKTVNTAAGKITDLDLNFDWGTLPPDSIYTITTPTGTVSKLTASIVQDTLTFKTPQAKSEKANLVEGSTVVGTGISGDITIASLTESADGKITGATLNISLGVPPANSQYYFSKVPGMFLSTGNMVFANQGLFAYTGDLTNKNQQNVLLNLQNQIVTAFNRGVANSGPTSGAAGYTSLYWGDESKWYPEGVNQNLFSLFMHTCEVGVPSATQNKKDEIKIPIFRQDSSSVKCARQTKMGQAYGFAYDENPMFMVSPAPVPSKFDPAPSSTTEMRITLGDWGLTD
ncbi:MAG: hypothetical protein Crog4KO_06340 [Crocinitomicaceae bacterium]